MRKPVKKSGTGSAIQPDAGEVLPAGRAWKRVEQFRLARGLDETPPGAPIKTRKSPSSAKPATRKAAKPK